MKYILKTIALLLIISCTSKFDTGMEYYYNNDFSKARSNFNTILKESPDYEKAQTQIAIIDSIIFFEDSISQFNKVNKLIKDSIQLYKKELALDSANIYYYQSELSLLKIYEPGSFYTIPSIFDEEQKLQDFRQILINIKNSDEPKIHKLYASYKNVLLAKQRKYYPIFRNSYCKQSKEVLWIDDIESRCIGRYNTTLEIISSELVSNRNKKQYSDQLYKGLRTLRFKRLNLKWYKDESGYTYYKIDSRSDTDIEFDKFD